ncbi:primosomal protein DnaI [Candidatus Uabimicrobium amorphum]|uniref:Primosomal protein DnaI n=1 Tax=Uabimicrobium amorphum TaxID=2596890 RepID=A0A5S9F6Z0_UABAM|nr:primosomal protein DnaI [Candidatus Uabimicrobium amorphum]
MSSEKKYCCICNNTGVLHSQVYYPNFDLSSIAYCKCSIGAQLFAKWCQSNKVQESIRNKRLQEVERALKFSNIPQQWQDKSFSNLRGCQHIKQLLHDYLENFYKKKIGIYLWSIDSRTGKTHVSIALCKKIMDRYVVPAIFITEEEMYTRIRSCFDNHSSSEEVTINKFKKINCLFIDDLGATKITKWKLEILTGILNFRLMNCKPTFFTSNYSIDQYQKKIAQVCDRPQRIPMRIREMADIIHMTKS